MLFLVPVWKLQIFSKLQTNHNINTEETQFCETKLSTWRVDYQQSKCKICVTILINWNSNIDELCKHLFLSVSQEAYNSNRQNILSFTLGQAWLYIPLIQNLEMQVYRLNFVWFFAANFGLLIFSSVILRTASSSKVLDTFGDHSIVCRNTDRRMWPRDAIGDLIFKTCVSASFAQRVNSSWEVEKSQQQQAVILPRFWSIENGLTNDNSVICSAQSSTISKASEENRFVAIRNKERKLSEKRLFGVSTSSRIGAEWRDL